MQEQPRSDVQGSEASEATSADESPPLSVEPAQPSQGSTKLEALLKEVTVELGDRLASLDRESEEVSGLIQDLGKYVERVGSLRGKLEEDVHRIGELREKLERDNSEVGTLRSQIEEEISHIDRLT